MESTHIEDVTPIFLYVSLSADHDDPVTVKYVSVDGTAAEAVRQLSKTKTDKSIIEPAAATFRESLSGGNRR